MENMTRAEQILSRLPTEATEEEKARALIGELPFTQGYGGVALRRWLLTHPNATCAEIIQKARETMRTAIALAQYD